MYRMLTFHRKTMTYLQILEQLKTLNSNEQKNLLSYLFFKYVNPDKENIKQLFHFNPDLDETSINDNKKPLDNFMKSKGILKNVDLSDISEEELYLQKD